MKLIRSMRHKRALEIAFFASLFSFSAWLMFRTFSYDYETSTILIGVNIWSDFAANLPLIRSFSMGQNWPPEYPIFPGHPIQYHYLFFLIVGVLEKLGVPIHWALNVPSILGFFLLLLMIYLLAKNLFADARIGLLSVAFFLFNGSLGFLQFFQKYPLSSTTFTDIVSRRGYTAMGPWDGGSVLGVWHLNVFINQRHFSIALGFLLAFLYACHYLERNPRKLQIYWALAFGALLGMLPLFHKPVLLMFAVVMSTYFIALPRLRWFLFATGAVSLLVMGSLLLSSFDLFSGAAGIGWHPGFMIHKSLSILNAAKFFWFQFGLHAVLIPIGLFLAPKRARIFILPALIVFIIAFLFRFSRMEVLVGHKFFNFFLILGQMITAFLVVKCYDFLSRKVPKTRIPAVALTSLLVFFLTLSGIIDLSGVVNMPMVRVRDIRSNPEARWFAENTPRDSVTLTSSFLYTPPSIAGRKIFLGWPYFTDSAGYDSRGRLKIVKTIYRGEDPAEMCRLLRSNNISYIDIHEHKPDKSRPPVNLQYFRSGFSPEYVSASGKYAVYTTAKLCEGQPDEVKQ